MTILGNGSQIIYRLATRDLKIIVSKNSKLSEIKVAMLQELRKNSKKELIDHKCEIEVEILRTELHNIDTFAAIRFSFYAIIIAVILAIKVINIENYIGLMLFIMLIMLFNFRYNSDTQKNRILYLKFKLKCIEELLNI
jgi:hypothetical protein